MVRIVKGIKFIELITCINSVNTNRQTGEKPSSIAPPLVDQLTYARLKLLAISDNTNSVDGPAAHDALDTVKFRWGP